MHPKEMRFLTQINLRELPIDVGTAQLLVSRTGASCQFGPISAARLTHFVWKTGVRSFAKEFCKI
jgi:hypothetical protein